MMIDTSPHTIGRNISNLVKHGFLKKHFQFGDVATLYYLSLPEIGMHTVMAGAKRGTGEGRASVVVLRAEASVRTFCTTSDIQPEECQPTPLQNCSLPPCKNAGTPPAKMQPLLININNNKNINHNHDSHGKIAEPRHVAVSNADALLCERKNLQEKYKNLPIRQQIQALSAHFSADDNQKMYDRERELRALETSKIIAAMPTPEFKAKLEQATPVPQPRTNRPELKLVEFEFEGEVFLVEERVKNQILNQIPSLHTQNQILGEAGKKSIKTLIAEIFYYVAKASSKALDACQLKRFYTARKLCLKGAWERPNGLERQASITREQKWQQDKITENKFAKEFTKEFMQNVA